MFLSVQKRHEQQQVIVLKVEDERVLFSFFFTDARYLPSEKAKHTILHQPTKHVSGTFYKPRKRIR